MNRFRLYSLTGALVLMLAMVSSPAMAQGGPFRTIATTIIGITDTAAQNVPTWDPTSTSVTVVLSR